MPKLDVFHFTYFAEEEKRSFEVAVSVSKGGQFYFNSTELPPELWALTKDTVFGEYTKKSKWQEGTYRSQVFHESLKPLHNAIDEACQAYQASLVRRDELKIIAYEFELEGEKVAETDDEAAINFGGEGWHRKVEHLAIKFHWRILRQLTNKSKVRRRGEDDVIYLDLEGNETHVQSDQRVIPWTAQHEAWFKGVEVQMKALMLGLERFMGMEETTVEKLIATGGTPLLTAGAKR